MPNEPRPDDEELLHEVARLTAALIRIVRRTDDPQLKAEIAELIWPKPVQPRRRPVARYWKFIIAIVGAISALVVALVGDGWFGDYGPVVLAFVSAVGVLIKANEPPGPITPQEVL